MNKISFPVFGYYQKGSHYYQINGYRIRVPRRFHSGLIPPEYKFAVNGFDLSNTEWLFANELANRFSGIRVS